MKIYIENKQLDITQELSSLLTFSIDDIKDFGARNTTFSKTIVLPGTANNNALFGNIFDARVSNEYDPALDNIGTNFNASKKADCYIFQNNLQVFKGILRVLKITIIDGFIEYECAVFGELGGFVNAMGNLKLQDLDFSAYDHTYGFANVSGSWNNTNASGYFYPLIDYGAVSTNKVDYDIRAFRPTLYVKEYIDKIFSGAGYSYNCDLFSTTRFKSLVIPHNQKDLTNNNIRWFAATKIDIGDYDIISGSGSGSASYAFTGIETPVNFTITPGTPDYDTFTYTGTTGVTGTLRFNLHGDYTNSGTTIQGQLRVNGTPILQRYFGGTAGVATEWQWEDEIAVTLTNGDVIDIYFTAFSGGTFNVGSDTGEFYFISDIPQQAVIAVGDTVSVTDTIPRNILQRDFLSSVLKLFNLYAYESSMDDKKIYIKPFVDFFDYNASGIVDWTYKVDRSKVIEYTPMSEINARYYNFKFKQDSDYYNENYRNRYGEGYGDYLYDSEYAFSGDKTDVELIFAATPLVGYSGVDKIVSAMYKKTNGVEEKRDNVIRILQTKKITGVTSWSMKDGVSTLQSGLTVYGYGGHYDDPDAPANDIQFGVPNELFLTLTSGAINVTQFNVYWSSYMAEISDKDSKLMTCYVKLDSADIFNLNFSHPIYIDGSLWRLNKIEDWNANFPDVCKVELLKVINTVY